jgi:glutamine amidotransferase
MISILDYGAGNLRSVENTLGAIGAEYELVRDADALRAATKMILPGVGHFGQMMKALDEMQVREALLDRIRAGVPFLGICLGLQALFESSEEAPEARGLGIFKGRAERFRGDGRIPHMGWNSLERERESRLLDGTGEAPYVYFANSFYTPAGEEASATCTYGVRFAAVIEHGNVHAVQFHPEKSGAVGLKMMSNFVCS